MPASSNYNSPGEVSSHHDRDREDRSNTTLPPISHLLNPYSDKDELRSQRERDYSGANSSQPRRDPLDRRDMDPYQRGPQPFSSSSDQGRGVNGRPSLPMHPGPPPQSHHSYSSGPPPPAHPAHPHGAYPSQPRGAPYDAQYRGPGGPPHLPPSNHPYGPTSPTTNGFGDGRGMPPNPMYGAPYQTSPQYPPSGASSNGYPSPYAESSPGGYGQDHPSNGPYEDRPTRRRRGNLPKWATDYLKQWFFEHIAHPYPTEQEKQELCKITGLGMTQLSNWFINARRRQHPVLTSQAAAETVLRQNSNHTANGEDRGEGDRRPR